MANLSAYASVTLQHCNDDTWTTQNIRCAYVNQDGLQESRFRRAKINADRFFLGGANDEIRKKFLQVVSDWLLTIYRCNVLKPFFESSRKIFPKCLFDSGFRKKKQITGAEQESDKSHSGHWNVRFRNVTNAERGVVSVQ